VTNVEYLNQVILVR